MTLTRWRQDKLTYGIELIPCEPNSLTHALHADDYAGAVILLSRPVLKSWPMARHYLVQKGTPTIILAPLLAEILHTLAFERELRLLALHIEGLEDSAACLAPSFERLRHHGTLQGFLRRFGDGAADLESLILPCWHLLSEIGSIESWAARLGREPETLARELRQHGVRSPRRLLTWLRLLCAWPMLESGRTAGEVALAVGYSAPPAFTRSTHRFVGVPPSLAQRVPMDQLIEVAASDLVA